MERLLGSPEFDRESVERALNAASAGGEREKNLTARLRNIDRLGVVRERARAELGDALEAMRGHAVQLHVLRFTGAGDASRMLVAQVAASLDAIVHANAEVATVGGVAEGFNRSGNAPAS
jgi:hypothetical protein